MAPYGLGFLATPHIMNIRRLNLRQAVAKRRKARVTLACETMEDYDEIYQFLVGSYPPGISKKHKKTLRRKCKNFTVNLSLQTLYQRSCPLV